MSKSKDRLFEHTSNHKIITNADVNNLIKLEDSKQNPSIPKLKNLKKNINIFNKKLTFVKNDKKELNDIKPFKSTSKKPQFRKNQQKSNERYSRDASSKDSTNIFLQNTIDTTLTKDYHGDASLCNSYDIQSIKDMTKLRSQKLQKVNFESNLNSLVDIHKFKEQSSQAFNQIKINKKLRTEQYFLQNSERIRSIIDQAENYGNILNENLMNNNEKAMSNQAATLNHLDRKSDKNVDKDTLQHYKERWTHDFLTKRKELRRNLVKLESNEQTIREEKHINITKKNLELKKIFDNVIKGSKNRIGDCISRKKKGERLERILDAKFDKALKLAIEKNEEFTNSVENAYKQSPYTEIQNLIDKRAGDGK